MCRKIAIRHRACNNVKVHRKKCAIAEQKTMEAGRSIWCKGGTRNLDEFTKCARCRTLTIEIKHELRQKLGVKPTTKCFCM